MDWEGPANVKSTWRFDCRVKHLVDMMYVKTLGLTDKDDFYAKMVREGLITRAEALQKLEAQNALYPDEVRTLLDQAGIQDPSILEAVDAAHMEDKIAVPS